MSPSFINSFFILVHYIILKLNVNSHPLAYEKKMFERALLLTRNVRYLKNTGISITDISNLTRIAGIGKKIISVTPVFLKITGITGSFIFNF